LLAVVREAPGSLVVVVLAVTEQMLSVLLLVVVHLLNQR
jgi:hypothetical protein